MNFPHSIFNNLFLVIIVCISFLYLHGVVYKEYNNYKTIRGMFIIVLVLIGLDAFVHYTETRGLRELEKVFLILETALIPCVGVLWLLFIRHTTKSKLSILLITIAGLGLLSINLALAILTFTSTRYHYYYEFADSVPHIAPLFFIFAIVILLPYIIATIMLINKWEVLKRKRRPSIFLFLSFFPLIGIFSQLISVDYTAAISSIVVTFSVICIDIQHQFAVTDYLTGLYNRRHLAKILRSRINRMKDEQIMAGYMIDINNFKKMNDEFGHAFGDEILIDFANILLNQIGPRDIVSRYGGDEFVVICDIKDMKDIMLFKNKLANAIETYNTDTSKRHHLEISVGYDVYLKKYNCTAETFLEIIDHKMYENKNQSKSKL